MSDSTTEKPWVVNGRTGVVVTYGQLLGSLNVSPVSLPRLCQPASTLEALRAIATAVAHDAEFTLFDEDFREREVRSLGFEPEMINRPVELAASRQLSCAKLARLAAGASLAKLGLFTSGSTGLPKLVWQSLPNLARAVKVSPRQGKAIWALAYNPTHVAGIQVYLQALANGCTVVDVYGLDRAAVMAALERHGVTHLSATPTFYRMLLPVDAPVPGVQSVTLGGECVDARLLERLTALFPAARFHNIYASTEAGTLLVADGEVFGIAEGLSSQVIVRDGKLHVHRSLLGEFAAKQNEENAKQNPTGAEAVEALKDEAENQLSGLRSQVSEWYDTGDVVEMVAEDPLRFRIVARERDWVNVGGSKVNPHEVEAVLGEHPGVRQVRVYGRKNSVMGHILCAEMVVERAQSGKLKPENGAGRQRAEIAKQIGKQKAESGEWTTEDGLTEAALRAWLGERLQPFKVPRLIRFVEFIGQTRTGKVSW